MTPDGDIENNVPSFAKKFASERCLLPGGAPPDACSTFAQKRQYAEAVCSVMHAAAFQVAHVFPPVLLGPWQRLRVTFALCCCRRVMTWWRGSTTSVCAC